jgi:hypothetical protein
MRTQTSTHYQLDVIRAGKPMAYNAERYPSRADARVAARRLGEYAEIRKVVTTVTRRLVERVEAN